MTAATTAYRETVFARWPSSAPQGAPKRPTATRGNNRVCWCRGVHARLVRYRTSTTSAAGAANGRASVVHHNERPPMKAAPRPLRACSPVHSRRHCSYEPAVRAVTIAMLLAV